MKRYLLAAIALATAIVGAAPGAQADPSPVGVANATGYYLALGDSLAAGYQPGQGDDRTGGYVGGVEAGIQASSPKTTLVNVACSGETSLTLVMGGTYCTYPEGSQLAHALAFLHSHGAMTRQITIDIGANDVQRCVRGVSVDPSCVETGFGQVGTYLPKALAALRAAAPNARILVLDYYDPFLAAWLTGSDGQALATESLVLQGYLNWIIAQAAAGTGGVLVPISTAFKTTDSSLTTLPGFGSLPTNVAMICTDTWMCTKGDIHANDAGYALMASAVIAKL